MVVQKIFILSVLITQALSAPSGCIESCNTFVKQYQSSRNFQDAGLSQIASRLQGLDYSKPGTWHEHNDYNTDNGHGKVHEEKGQIVDGPKTVRYYKKNYSSSYSNHGGGLSDFDYQNRHGVHVPSIEEMHNSQTAYNQMHGLESLAQQQQYNRIQNQQHTQSSIRRTNAQSERLEDLGEYSGNSQMIHQGASDLNTQITREPYNTNIQSENWSTVNSYKTDGGRGRVFEEEGQYVTGAKKIRYYKRNYTSSYGSVNGVPIPDIAPTGVNDMQTEIDKLHREIGKVSQISRAGTLESSNIAQAHINTHDLSSGNLHSVDNNNYRNPNSYGSTSSIRQHDEEQHTSSVTNEHLPYRSPTQNVQGTNSYSTYEKHEGHVKKIYPSNQVISPTSGYTSVLSTGNSGYNRNTYGGSNLQQHRDDLQQSETMDAHQSRLVQNQKFLNNLRETAHTQDTVMSSGAPGQIGHYKEHWTASHTKEQSIPQYSTGITHMNQHGLQYNSQYGNEHQGTQHDRYSQQYKQSGYATGQRSHSGQLVTGTLDLGQGTDNVDCAYDQQQSRSSIQYQRKYKREAKYNEQQDDFTQQTGQFDDLTEQTSAKIELDQGSQQSYEPWNLGSDNQRMEDLIQQTDVLDDLTQQTSGKLEFGEDSQQTYQSWKPISGSQKLEDLTQQTHQSDDLTQQTSGKLEFGQETQQTFKPWKPSSTNPKSEDLTQQTSGKLEFGQETQQNFEPWKLDSANSKSDDFTQQTDQFDDLSQQTSGKLEFGQETQQTFKPWKPSSTNPKSEDLTQQTSGKLEFGQETQQNFEPWKLDSANSKSDDFTQQTDQFDDLSQQTSGKLEFGQETQQTFKPWKPSSTNPKSEDLTQQTSGKLEFGHETQQNFEPWKLDSANSKSDDFTQQTDQFDDLSQQTSGKLEFGQETQQTFKPWKPSSTNPKSEDLTQQTSGKLEFGQETQQNFEPWKLDSANSKSNDFTQQTDQFDDLTQQTSGKLEFGQETQQTFEPWKPSSTNPKSEDLTQQTSGKLEYGQETQQNFEPWKPSSTNPKSEDLTQQTSGKLEFGQEIQQNFEPWKLDSANSKSDDFTQQIDQFDDLSQQTSGKLEFGQETQQTFEPWKPSSTNPKSEDLTQQTSGKLEFGQETQQNFEPWKPSSINPKSEDLTQQTSGKLEFGQETQQNFEPWKPSSINPKSDDFTQQTDQFDDFTQQTTGKLEYGQGSQQTFGPWEPDSADQKLGDVVQHTSDSLNQQTSRNLEYSQESQQTYQPWKPNSASQEWKDLIQQTGNMPMQEGPESYVLKPAEKPKPRTRHLRLWSATDMQSPTQNVHNNQKPMNSNNKNTDVGIIDELPLKVDTDTDTNNVRSHNIRGDLGIQSSTGKDQLTAIRGYDVEGGNMDQGNWLHKSNDATVGLQWHYTYHPSDQRQLFVQQVDQKDKEGTQQQSTQMKFTNFQESSDQEIRNKYTVVNLHQQPHSENHAPQGVKTMRRTYSNFQRENRLTSDQQISGSEDSQKNVKPTETEPKLEPRIVEAYGGGQYNPSHSDDIYSRVTVNPSATLPPPNNEVPWYIREKPEETITEATPPPMPVEPLDINKTTEAPRPPNFWSRLGNRITTTFDKARDTARNIFG